MLTPRVHDFSDSIFCTAPSALDPTRASIFWDKKEEDVVKRNSCKNKNDIAGQSINIERHVCPGDTRLRKHCKSSKHSCRRWGTDLRLFGTKSFSRACLGIPPTGKVRKHPVFQCANILQTGVSRKRKKRRGVGNIFQKKKSQKIVSCS